MLQNSSSMVVVVDTKRNVRCKTDEDGVMEKGLHGPILDVGAESFSLKPLTLCFRKEVLEAAFKGYHSRKHVDSTVMKLTFATAIVYCISQIAWWNAWAYMGNSANAGAKGLRASNAHVSFA